MEKHKLLAWYNKVNLNIHNLLYIEEDLNVRDAEWNSFVSLYPIAGQVLRDLANFYSFIYLILALSVPIHYLDIQDHTNLVIDLIITLKNIFVCKMVLKCDSEEEVIFLLSISEELP